MKKKNFNKKLNLNKSIVSNLSSLHMLKINGGGGLNDNGNSIECDTNYTVDPQTTHTEPQAASTAILGGGKI
jgi:hypothetical protein